MLQVRLQSYLIQLSLQGGHLSGAGKSHVQARRDGVDEVNVMLFGCSYQSRQLFWVWKEKSQLFLLVKYVVQSWFKLEPPFEPAGTSWDQLGPTGCVWALLGLTCLPCRVQVSPVHPVLGVVFGGVQVGVQAPPLLPEQKQRRIRLHRSSPGDRNPVETKES